MQRSRSSIVVALALSFGCAQFSFANPLNSACAFFDTGDYAAAALDFRRAAAEEDSSETRAHLYLAAAEAYMFAGCIDRMERMLDHAEEEQSDAIAGDIHSWLRVAHDEIVGDWSSAAIWAESMVTAETDSSIATNAQKTARREIALRHATVDALRAHDYATAKRLADKLDDSLAADSSLARSVVDSYVAGHDKSPRIGGLLGIIPGMGYAYAGEYGNMFRSMFLNGIFIWAMVETASDDQWALFTAASFFELTWFTGSIYGGVDATHRANRFRLDSSVRELLPPVEPTIRPVPRLDIFRLRLEF